LLFHFDSLIGDALLECARDFAAAPAKAVLAWRVSGASTFPAQL
jgi:hypothetical protein